MATLADQIRAQGGDWTLAGIDRAAELAELLRRAGVSTLQPIVKVPAVIEHRPGGRWSEGNSADPNGSPPVWTPDPTYTITEAITRLRIGGVEVGFVGDANNDGSYSNASQALKTDDMVAWSARGDGNVAYHAATGPDGKVRIFPSHGSSSDLTRSLKNFLTAVAVIAGGVLLVGAVAPGAAAAGAAGAEGAAAAGAATAGASGATNAALIESALQTAGYGASSAGLGGGAGVLAGAGATNAALIESALQTAGYGASSAGAGGGAGVLASAGAGAGLLSDIGSALGTAAQNIASSAVGTAANAVVDAALSTLLPAGPAPGAAVPYVPAVVAAPPAGAAVPGGLVLAALAVLVAIVI